MAEIWGLCSSCGTTYDVDWDDFVSLSDPPGCLRQCGAPSTFQVRIGDVTFPVFVADDRVSTELRLDDAEVGAH